VHPAISAVLSVDLTVGPTIDVVVVRDGKNLKGRLLDLVLGRIGEGVLEKAFKNSVKAIEARNGVEREVGAA
jgi:hypothetical protein